MGTIKLQNIRTFSFHGCLKEEALIGVAYEPEIRSDLFIERGKNSALESIERLGEVDNIGDLVKYGYGFFNVET